MKWLCAIILFSLCGCSVTMSARIHDPVSVEQGSATDLAERHARLSQVVQSMNSELQETSASDAAAINEVLRKYGIQVGTRQTNQ